jgi:hypothetical protein
MLTGEMRNQIDRIWDAFWSGGIANPLEVIEQITYLLFLRRLDDLHTLEELKATRLKRPMERRVFPQGKDNKRRPYEDFRWSRFKNFEPREMYTVVSEHVFPWLRTLGANGSTYAHHMKDARFTIPTPALLAKVVDLIDHVPMEDRDTKGDLYEYMLGKIATAGQNGQFRTPRHIIRLMVEMVEPTPKDIVCDPACGTCGFLLIIGEYLRQHHWEVLQDPKLKQHFHHGLFHGFDFDSTMLRIGSMNMLLHGVENPDVVYRDSLSQDHAGEEEKYTLVLANPPFAGSLDYENTAKDLLQVVKTKKTELLFLALFLRLLKPAGRAAVIVPDGVPCLLQQLFFRLRTLRETPVTRKESNKRNSQDQAQAMVHRFSPPHVNQPRRRECPIQVQNHNNGQASKKAFIKAASTRYVFPQCELIPSGKTIAAASIPGANSTPTADHLGTLAIAPTSTVRASPNTNDHAYLRRCGFNVWCNSLRVARFLSVRVCHTVRYRYGHGCLRFGWRSYSETEHSKRRVKSIPGCGNRILHLLRIDCLLSIVVCDDKRRIPPIPFLETCMGRRR